MVNKFYYFMYYKYNLHLSVEEIFEIQREVNKIKVKDDGEQKK